MPSIILFRRDPIEVSAEGTIVYLHNLRHRRSDAALFRQVDPHPHNKGSKVNQNNIDSEYNVYEAYNEVRTVEFQSVSGCIAGIPDCVYNAFNTLCFSALHRVL